MISYLKGELIEKKENCIIVEVGGIGYEIGVSTLAIMELPAVKNFVKIYTYMYVRDDVLALFGFNTKDDLEMFRMLITVNGIGPKAALAILSTLTSSQIKFAIIAEDFASLTKAPGIGKKTAAKLILELKDKLDLKETINSAFEDTAVDSPSVSKLMQVKDEVIQALLALGISASDAMKLLSQIEIDENISTDMLLKQCLKKL